MSDPTITETCSCGASTAVGGMDRRDTIDQIDAWRKAHLCTVRRAAAGFGTEKA
jgi:hypothetical protein